MAQQGFAFDLTAPGAPLTLRERAFELTEPDTVLLAVEACGLCHTDLGFADGSVAPKHPLPLTLGHEIIGRAVEGSGVGEALIGKRLLVPAVLPCGACEFCKSGRANACPRQRMPGNDIQGGFASHVVLPAASLVPVDNAPGDVDYRALSVVADAVSTAYQATRRAGLASGDLAIVIGAGGVGGFLAQIARAQGASVIACDVNPDRLGPMAAWSTTIDVRDRAPKDVRKEAQTRARELDIPSLRWRIFECSGTAGGQQLAFSLLGTAATLVIVGFTRSTVEVRLSNLMAFDASVHGTWGCPPEAYGDVLDLVYAGKVDVAGAVAYAPLHDVNSLLNQMAAGVLSRRMVLVPNSN